MIIIRGIPYDESRCYTIMTCWWSAPSPIGRPSVGNLEVKGLKVQVDGIEVNVGKKADPLSGWCIIYFNHLKC